MGRFLATAALALLAAWVSCTAQAAQAAQPALPTALVVTDPTPLRAAPRDAAPLLVTLWRGEALELRAVRGDWVQVWDAHRERGGFVRAAQLLELPPGEAGVPELAAQLRLVRQQAGAESLGVGVAAALIERAGPAWLGSAQGAEMLDTLGLLLDRLAQRAQTATAAQQAAAAAQADVAARYGFAPRTLARADGTQALCPSLAPASLLRAHPAASAAQKLRAALALTRSDCPAATDAPTTREAALQQRAAWLEGIALGELQPVDRNRLLLRRASVLASLAFAQRAGDPRAAAEGALAAWLQLIRPELGDDEAPAVREAAIRLSPLRWMLQPATPLRRLGRFELQLAPGEPGQTCLLWRAAAGEGPERRCSHGVVHLASARLAPDGSAVALAVQPLDGWTELWRIDAQGLLQVLPPSADPPGLGAAEFAGWAAGKEGPQLLVAREADSGTRSLRRFEVYGAALDQPLRWSVEAGALGAFQRSADPAWRAASTLGR